MTEALRRLIESCTCGFCHGEGKLTSRAVKYVGEPAWFTIRDCPRCGGSGTQPTSNEKDD